MRDTRHPAARLVALAASLATVAVLVSLPCSMGAEACALSPVTAAGASARCPMAANGGHAMECCAKGESPRQSGPATPAGPTPGQQLQLKVLPVGADVAPTLPAAPAVTALPEASRAETCAAPATPLYTLLSTLLS